MFFTVKQEHLYLIFLAILLAKLKRQEEIKGVTARFEQDSTGRYISISIYEEDEDGNLMDPVTYSLTTNTTN